MPVQRLVASVLVLVACAVVGCTRRPSLGSGSGSEYELAFSCGGLDEQSHSPRWGSVTPVWGNGCLGAPYGFVVWLPRNTVLPEDREMIEIYPEGSEVPVPIAGALTRDLVKYFEEEGELHYDAVYYDLSELRGLYRVVHRRSAVPEGLEPYLPYDSGWGSFDGEDALVTTVLLGIDPRLYDGDLPDAG